jgi:hypothetical protein
MMSSSQKIMSHPELSFAATIIQRLYRGYSRRLRLYQFHSDYAIYYATKIQHAYRQRLSRRRSLENFYAYLSSLATDIKMCFRRHRTSQRVSQRAYTLRTRRVLLLQSLYRRRQARHAYDARRQEWLDALGTRVTAVARGFLYKRRAAHIRTRYRENLCTLVGPYDLTLIHDAALLKVRWQLDRWTGFTDILLYFMMAVVDSALLVDLCRLLSSLYPGWGSAHMLLQFFLLRFWSEHGKMKVVRYDLLEEAVELAMRGLHLQTEDEGVVDDLEHTLLRAYFEISSSQGAPPMVWKAAWSLSFHRQRPGWSAALLHKHATSNLSQTPLNIVSSHVLDALLKMIDPEPLSDPAFESSVCSDESESVVSQNGAYSPISCDIGLRDQMKSTVVRLEVRCFRAWPLVIIWAVGARSSPGTHFDTRVADVPMEVVVRPFVVFEEELAPLLPIHDPSHISFLAGSVSVE